MKKRPKSAATPGGDEMRDEYDFSGQRGVRGKYYERYRQGHTVRVRHEDGTTSVRHFTLEDGAVLLDPDVRRYFPDSDSVNRALRALVEIAPTKAKAAPLKSD